MNLKEITWNSHADILLKFQWQIERQPLSFFLGPGLTSTSPLNLTKRLHSHANTIWKILNNRKIRIQNFVVIFKNFPQIKTGNTGKCKTVVKNKLKIFKQNVRSFPNWTLLKFQISTYFLVVKNPYCHLILRQINRHL